MLTRLYTTFRNRSLQVVIASVYLILLTALTALLLHELHLAPLQLIITEVLLAGILALLVERATSSARGIAFLMANDLKISLAASLVLTVAGVLAFFRDPVAISPTRSIPFAAAVSLYLGSGILLGSSLRRLVSELITRALFGRPRFFTSLCLISLWFLTAAIALIPVHRNALPAFLLGIACGIFIHQGLTLRLNRAVAAYRRLFEVQSRVPETLPLAANERTALSLLAAGRHPFTSKFSALRSHIDDCRNRRTMSNRLHLISACAWRLEGRYTDAIEDTKIASSPPTDNVDAQLLLIRALSLEDRDDSADDNIDEILNTLTSSEIGQICPLTRALQARRTAERSIDSSGIVKFSKEPLNNIVTSLDLRRGVGIDLERTIAPTADEATEFFRGFVAHGVPVTPSWLLDVFGYSLIVAGCPEEGRVFLQRCISLDPSYSYSYLHLGDYFLVRRTGSTTNGYIAAPGKTGWWHAQTCYLLAERIERSKASRVKRIARSRLELLDRLQQARTAG